MASLPHDYFVKVSGTGHIKDYVARRMPMPNVGPLDAPLLLRTLRLNCLTADYAPLWEEIAWARPSALPADLGRALAQAQQPTGPSAERLLLDLHSGRFLGPLGPWLMDAAALGLLLLAATGLWTVLQRPRRGSTR